MSGPSLFADDALLTCTNVLASHKRPLVSISGGSDSDVMLDIISRTGHIDKCTFLFVNTGLEYKATTDHLDYLEDRYHIHIDRVRQRDPVPTCSNKYLNDTEYCLFVRERGVPLYGGYKDHGTYWTTTTNTADKKIYGHPTIKPLDIIRTMIRNSSQPGDTVLDPFLGSGTTQVQQILEGRECVGQEIDPGYQRIITKRLNSIQDNTRWFR